MFEKVKEFLSDLKGWIIVGLTGVIAWLTGVLDAIKGIAF